MYKPISKELFADLLVYLDSVSIGTKCDGISMKHSEEFLRSRSFNEDTVQEYVDFFQQHGASCDCELPWNVSSVVYDSKDEANKYYDEAKARAAIRQETVNSSSAGRITQADDFPLEKNLFYNLVSYLARCKCRDYGFWYTKKFFDVMDLGHDCFVTFTKYCKERSCYGDGKVSDLCNDAGCNSGESRISFSNKAKQHPILKECLLATDQHNTTPAFVRVLIDNEKYFLKVSLLKQYYQMHNLIGLDALEKALMQNRKTILTLDENGEKFIVVSDEIASSHALPKHSLPFIPVSYYNWNTMLLPSVPTHLKLRVAKVFNYRSHEEPVFIIVDRKTHQISPHFSNTVFATYDEAVDAIIAYTQERVAKKFGR